MKAETKTNQKIVLLTFLTMEPGFCSSYWKSARGAIYAYTDGELYACSEDGEPSHLVHFPFQIKIPTNLEHGYLSQGFYPGLSVEGDPLETGGKYPHMHRYKLFGPALDGEEDVARWFCMECGIESPPVWDVRDGCISCDSDTDAITEHQIRGY